MEILQELINNIKYKSYEDKGINKVSQAIHSLRFNKYDEDDVEMKLVPKYEIDEYLNTHSDYETIFKINYSNDNFNDIVEYADRTNILIKLDKLKERILEGIFSEVDLIDIFNQETSISLSLFINFIEHYIYRKYWELGSALEYIIEMYDPYFSQIKKIIVYNDKVDFVLELPLTLLSYLQAPEDRLNMSYNEGFVLIKNITLPHIYLIRKEYGANILSANVSIILDFIVNNYKDVTLLDIIKHAIEDNELDYAKIIFRNNFSLYGIDDALIDYFFEYPEYHHILHELLNEILDLLKPTDTLYKKIFYTLAHLVLEHENLTEEEKKSILEYLLYADDYLNAAELRTKLLFHFLDILLNKYPNLKFNTDVSSLYDIMKFLRYYT